MNSPSCQVLYHFTIFHMRISESLPGPLGFSQPPNEQSHLETFFGRDLLEFLILVCGLTFLPRSPLKCPYSSAFYYYYYFFCCSEKQGINGRERQSIVKTTKKKPSWFTSSPSTTVSRIMRRLHDVLKKVIWEYLGLGVWWRTGLPAEVVRHGFGAQCVGSALQMFTGTPPVSWMGQ